MYFSAVLAGVKELRRVIDDARSQQQLHGRQSILFVDEIHRFNKAQQDAFLPHVEDGTIVLVGATTENPSFEVIAPLLSRTSVLVLKALSADDVRVVVQRALTDRARGLGGQGLSIDSSALEFLAAHAQGDARTGLNVLETAADLARRIQSPTVTLPLVEEAAQHRAIRYDKSGDEHYNVVSAFIKSLRGSDPDAALYWMVRMLEAGEAPLFIARRMIIFAAEDVGTADPRALTVAVAAKEAFHFIGLPEGRIPPSRGGCLSGHGSQIERLVQRPASGDGRRGRARHPPGATPPPQRAHRADAKPGPRPGIRVCPGPGGSPGWPRPFTRGHFTGAGITLPL